MSFPKQLNLGSGMDFRYDCLNLDVDQEWDPDVVHDLNRPLPEDASQRFVTERFGEITVARDSFDRIIAHDVLEHVPNLLVCMTSCLNLLKLGGVFQILVPYELSRGAWRDPTHVRAFNEDSWAYFTGWFWYLGWTEARFVLDSLHHRPSRLGSRLQGEGRSVEEILRTPRAIEHMAVSLKKVALNEGDRRELARHRRRRHDPATPEIIWVVGPDQDRRPLDDLAQALHSACAALGMKVTVVREAAQVTGPALVLGADRIPETGLSALPKELTLFNLEPVGSGPPWADGRYLNLLKSYPVWDCSRANSAALEKLGVRRVTYCALGYAPELTRIAPAPQEDVDVLFYGTVNERRGAVLDALESAGIKVLRLHGQYGAERDAQVARSKIVLNLHLEPGRAFEIVRVSYLLANKKFVVAEVGGDAGLESPFADGVVFCEHEQLVDTCLRYLQDAAARARVAARGFDLMRRRPQADLLRQALGAGRSVSAGPTAANLEHDR